MTYEEIAAEEMCSALRELADLIEKHPVLSTSDIAEALEDVALRTKTHFGGIVDLGVPMNLGPKAIKEGQQS